MKPVILRPDEKYRTKLFVISTLFVLLVSASWTIPLGIGIGADTGDTGGAFLGFMVTALLNVVGLMIVFLFIPAYYNSLRYEIHEDEVIVYAGIINKTVKHVPFRTVTNLTVARGPIDRIFGFGSLAIQTAGMSGTTGAEENLVGLPNVDEVYAQVAGELRRFRGAMSPDQSGDELAPGQAAVSVGDPQLLADILDELRAIRAEMKQP